MRFLRQLGVALALVAGLGACARSLPPDNLTTQQVGEVSQVERGTILQARPVTIEQSPEDRGIGTVAGAGIGGVAGSAIGGDIRFNAIGAIAGAVIGGLIGSAVEEEVSSQTGIEYVVELDDGGIITVVQGDDSLLAPGTRVLFIEDYSGGARVVADNTIGRSGSF